MTRHQYCGLAFILIGLAISTRPADAQTISFLRQIVTSEGSDGATGVVADATGIYVAGYTTAPLALSERVFVRKYDLGGAELWTRRFGGPLDVAGKIALDDTGIYMVGNASGALPGQRSAGGFDAFVRKYDEGGTELWTRQFGTSASDAAIGASADGTGVYVVGQIGAGPGAGGEGFLRKYDPNGAELWTRQFATLASGVAVDDSSVFVVGYAAGRSGAAPSQPLLRKYDKGGSELWTRQPDSSGYVSSVAADASGVYVAAGTPEAPGTPATGFIVKYDGSGNQLWIQRLNAWPGLVAVDATGVYLVTRTDTTLPGQCSAGDYDVVVRKYGHGGPEVWTRQFGTLGFDFPSAAAVGGSGVYVVGNANRPTGRSAFLAKLEDAPALVTDSRPRILWDCVVNGASYVGGGVAPGEIVAIFGSGIGPRQLERLRLNQEGRLAATLAGTRILFNNIPAPLLYVSEKQSSAIVPYGVAGSATVAVQVEYNGIPSDAVTLPVLDAHPGIFTVDGSGRGQAAVLNEDGTLNSPSNPAQPGSMVTMYATGEGLTDRPEVEGLLLTDLLPRPRLPVSVIFDATESGDYSFFLRAEVLYAGAVSNSVAGLIQLKMRLPRDLRSGNWAPQLVIGLDDFEPGAGPWSWVTRSSATIAVGQADGVPIGPQSLSNARTTEAPDR